MTWILLLCSGLWLALAVLSLGLAQAAKRGDGAAGYVEAYCILDAHTEIVVGELRKQAAQRPSA